MSKHKTADSSLWAESCEARESCEGPFVREVTRGQDDHVLALVTELTRALGLDCNEELTLAVKRKAVELFEERLDVEYDESLDWHRLGAKREVVRVLGAAFASRAHLAYDEGDHTEEARMAKVLRKELLTCRRGHKHCAKQRRRLDPDCWSLGDGGPDQKPYSVYIHLAQLSEVVRLQNEKEVREARAGRPKLRDGALRPEERRALAAALERAAAG